MVMNLPHTQIIFFIKVYGHFTVYQWSQEIFGDGYVLWDGCCP